MEVKLATLIFFGLCLCASAIDRRAADYFWASATADPFADRLQVRLHAHEGAVLTGGLVSELTDLSGRGWSATQSIATNRPGYVTGGFNGLNLLTLNGTNQFMELPGGLTASITGTSVSVFFVASKTKSGVRSTLMNLSVSPTTASKIFIDFQADNTLRAGGRTLSGDSFQGAVSSSTFSTNSLAVWSARLDAQNQTIVVRRNLSVVASNNVAFGSSEFSTTVGTAHNLFHISGTFPHGGRFGEARIYLTLTPTEHVQVGTELMEYWGITP